MSKKKIYLSMPITGYDINERMNRAETIKGVIESLDDAVNVVTPFDASPYDSEKSYGTCMIECVRELLNCNLMIVDEGHELSRGCLTEIAVADACDIERMYLNDYLEKFKN